MTAISHLLSWLFTDGLAVLTLAVGIFLGGIRYRLIELKKDVHDLIEMLEAACSKASIYWIESPAETDRATVTIIQKTLHDIAVEGMRVHNEYRIFSKETLTKYNDKLNEVITINMSSNRQIDTETAKKIGRLTNSYKAYLKRHVAKKMKFLGALAFSSHKLGD